MKKIEEKQIETYYKLIEKSDLMSIDTKKATLFFPIGLEEVVTNDNEPILLLEEKDRVKSFGSNASIRTGLVIIDEDGEKVIKIAYATTQYAAPFIIKDHYRYLRTTTLKKKELVKLEELEAYLLMNEYILGTFKY